MLVSESITKIRRLIRDENSAILTSDNQLLNQFGRVQQRFAIATGCLVKVVSLLAPPHTGYCVSHQWEEGYVSSKVWSPFYKKGAYASTQAFEHISGHDLAGDGYTVTAGADVERVDPQHPIPLFPPVDFYKPLGLFWDYKWVEQKGFDEIDRDYDDGWDHKNDVVDFFAQAEGLRQKALVTRGIPSTVNGETIVAVTELWPGVDLVSNGKNWTGATGATPPTGWTNVAATPIHTIFDSGDGSPYDICLKFELDSGSNPGIYQTVTVVVGQTYRASISLKCVAPAYTIHKVGSFFNGSDYSGGVAYLGTSWKSFTYEFVATTNLVSFLVTAVTSTPGKHILIDEVKLEQVRAFRTVTDINEDTAIDTALDENLFHLVYEASPERPSETSGTVEVQDPFVKYIEFEVASRLLLSHNQLRDKMRGVHLNQRYQMGVSLVNKIVERVTAEKLYVLGSAPTARGGRPPRPRLPDHYPRLPVGRRR